MNASFSHGEGGRFSLDLRANSPRIEPSDDADVSVESAGSSVHTGDNDTNDLETDLKMVELQLEDGSLSIPQPATRNSHLSVDDESEADGSAEDEAVAPMGQFYSCGTAGRRGSEIMGQRKIEGIDGEHRYFDLKVQLAISFFTTIHLNMRVYRSYLTLIELASRRTSISTLFLGQ